MRETDGRKLKHDVLEALRIRAVQCIEDGESPEIVIKALGMNRRTIYKWIALYREQGVDALKATTFRETIKAEWCKTAVDIQDSYHKEPFTIEVSICTVDAGDGKGTY